MNTIKTLQFAQSAEVFGAVCDTVTIESYNLSWIDAELNYETIIAEAQQMVKDGEVISFSVAIIDNKKVVKIYEF